MKGADLIKSNLYIGKSLITPTGSADYLLENLMGGETILLAATASTNGKPGVIAITNKRVVAASKVLFSKHLFDIDLRKITGIEHISGIQEGFRVKGPDNKLEALCPGVSQQLVNKIKEAQAAADVQTVVIAQPAGGNNNLGDLEKLADLKAKGIITEEEFAAKKKAILGL